VRHGSVRTTKNDIDNNLLNVVKTAFQSFKAPENLTVSEWADRYRKLSPENSAEAGQWKTSRTPYLKEIMDAFTDDSVYHIVVVAGSQVGKTECELNMLGYMIDQDPGPAMFVLPALDKAEDFSKRRLTPMLRDTEPLKGKIEAAKAKSGNNTILKKIYPGGMLTFAGSNSPSSLASIPARYVFGDEVDRWTRDAGGEGDPWKLLEARTTTFYNRKMVEVSTPTIKGNSPIVSAFELGTQEYWSVQCPDCGEYHFINFDSMRFDPKVIKVGGRKQFLVDKVEYACPECGCINSEQTMRHQPMKWIPKSPEAITNGCRSFWINAFTSPWKSWQDIVREFLDSKDDPEKLKTVYNTLFGQLWEERAAVDEDEIISRAEEYNAELPEGVLCLTCGVDTQDDRLEYEVVGYGFFEENWGIEKGIIMGRPSEEETWIKLDGILNRVWHFADGKGLRISLTFVDSGGHYTQEVYEHCAQRIGRRVFAIKGANKPDTPYTAPPNKVNITKQGQTVGKAWLYMIGVDAGKEHIYSGLKVEKEGARRSHFPSNPGRGYDALFYSGLLSERMTYKNGKWVWDKLPGHERNEALDCRNYANAAFVVLHPNLDDIKLKLSGIEKPKENAPKRKLKRQRRRSGYDDFI
jgi:phage terminase large subunit GpA-like protein